MIPKLYQSNQQPVIFLCKKHLFMKTKQLEKIFFFQKYFYLIFVSIRMLKIIIPFWQSVFLNDKIAIYSGSVA
jgi:hypothetical protein